MLATAPTEAEGPQLVSLHEEHTNPHAGQGPVQLPTNILVPADGTEIGRLAIEIAVALARAGDGRQTVACAQHHGVDAVPIQIAQPHPNRVIRRMAASGTFALVVLGADLRNDGEKHLGPRTAELVRSLRAPLLLLAR